MSHAARSALVLQGDGELGAYELGAVRALYEDDQFAPDLIAGFSIGAITAALLARPARGLKPLQALEAFWAKVGMSDSFLPASVYASLFGNPNFFVPRHDYFSSLSWTYIYDTNPLRQTLSQLIDLAALADRNALPGLLASATDVKEGQIQYFYSREESLSLDHIVASSSLPPSFAMTSVGGKSYWDGGVFDNTPLGAVLDRLDQTAGADRTVYVVNLFDNKATIPSSLIEVVQRVQSLQFANKTAQDLKLLHRFDQVAALMNRLEALPGGNPLKDDETYKAVKAQNYIVVPKIVSITRPNQVGTLDGSDFSRESIHRRAAEGYNQTKTALREGAPRAPQRREPAELYGRRHINAWIEDAVPPLQTGRRHRLGLNVGRLRDRALAATPFAEPKWQQEAELELLVVIGGSDFSAEPRSTPLRVRRSGDTAPIFFDVTPLRGDRIVVRISFYLARELALLQEFEVPIATTAVALSAAAAGL